MSSLNSSFLIDHSRIDSRAIEIISKLKNKGFVTYLVGGCVRDLLIGQTPKDFDIATTAHPHEVRKCISHSFIIGKRFRLVLVKRGSDQFEVATFRRNINESDLTQEENSFVSLGDNYFGTPEEDALRRDFKINALFYDPLSQELIDFCKGLDDIKNQKITMLGDPEVRLIEDPIRILRAIRFKYLTGFSLNDHLRECMKKYSQALKFSVLPRRREEILKILRLKDPSLPLLEALDLGVLEAIAPNLTKIFLSQPQSINHFFNYLRGFHDQIIDKQNPLELFGFFIVGLYEFFFKEQISLKFEDMMEHPILDSILKDELGLFKAEHAFIIKSLSLLPLLENKEAYLRKGMKRRESFIQNEHFYLAHRMALKLGLLDCETALLWDRESSEIQIKKRREKSSTSSSLMI